MNYEFIMIEQLIRIVESIISLFLIDSYHNLEYNEQIEVSVSKKRKKFFLQINPIKIFTIENEWINIEFFKELEDMVDISICNQDKKIVYSLSTFTAPTLHIIIRIGRWLPGIYTLYIKGKEITLKTFIIKKNCFYIKKTKN